MNAAKIDTKIELSNYELWQLETRGNILPEPIINPNGELESGAESLDRLSDWMHQWSERQLHEYEQEFYSY